MLRVANLLALETDGHQPFTPLAGRLGFFDVPSDVLSRIIQNQ